MSRKGYSNLLKMRLPGAVVANVPTRMVVLTSLPECASRCPNCRPQQWHRQR